MRNNITVAESLSILQYHYISQRLNCKQSSPFKYFHITIRYSFLFTRKFREYLFSKRLLICQEKTIPSSNYFLGDYGWGVGISM